MTKSKRTSKILYALFITCLVSLCCLGITLSVKPVYAGSMGGLNGIMIYDVDYNEDSDTGMSWGEGDHWTYDNHIHITCHNAASFFGYDLTDWVKGRVQDLKVYLLRTAGDAGIRFRIYMTSKTEQIDDHDSWGKGLVTIDLYKDNVLQRSASFNVDMSSTAIKDCDMYLGILDFTSFYSFKFSLKFATSDGLSWGNYQGSWNTWFALNEYLDYEPYLSSGYVYNDGKYYYNQNSYYMGWNDTKPAYKDDYEIYTMPSGSATDNGNTYNNCSAITTEGPHLLKLYSYNGTWVKNFSTVMDRSKPTGTLYGGDNVIVSGGSTKEKYIKFVASDAYSPIDKVYVRKPGSGSYVTCANESQFSDNGTYYFYCTDIVGNVSDTYSIKIDNSPPILSCTGAQFGSKTSNYFTVKATDAHSSCELFYKASGMSSYVSTGSDTMVVPITSPDGKYYFYAVDTLGNKSEEKLVELYVAPPTATIVHSDKNGVYATWSGDYTVLLDGKEYVKGMVITKEGDHYLSVYSEYTNRTSSYEFSVGHYYEKQKVVKPTCTEKGYTIYKCVTCDDTYNDNYVPANGHSYTTRKVAPTCTDEGYTIYTCSVCGYECHDDFIKANGHTYKENVISPTCIEKGYTIYTCSVCGYTYNDNFVDELGHVYHKEKVKPTCTEKGYTIYTCTRCGYSYNGDYVDANGHSFTSEITYPTCTQMGYTTYKCSVCGYAYIDNYIDALGHDYASFSFNATCTEKGGLLYVCRRCGDEYTILTSEELGHQYYEIKVEPTCTERGYINHICSVCGYEYHTEHTMAVGHLYATVAYHPPDCEHAGERDHVCEKCGYSYYNIIECPGHDYETVEEETDKGVKITYTCKVCGESHVEYKETRYEYVADYVTDLVEMYTPYMIWVFLSTTGVWSIIMGVSYAVAKHNDDKEKSKKMIKNYLIGLIVIFGILVACPYLVQGIAMLFTL